MAEANLKEKVQKMPEVATTVGWHQAKNGKRWFVVKTTITKFFSEAYMSKVESGKDSKAQAPVDADPFA